MDIKNIHSALKKFDLIVAAWMMQNIRLCCYFVGGGGGGGIPAGGGGIFALGGVTC
jgi:hypothetical protein